MRPRILKYSADQEYFFQEGCYINELSNRPEDGALSIARARLEPGEATRLHKLEGIVERYLILQGVGWVEVGELAPREVGAGDVVVVPAGCPQRISNSGGKELIFLALCTPRFTPECYVDLGLTISA